MLGFELLNSETGALLAGSDVQTIRGQILLIKAEHAYFANRCLEAIDLCRQVLALFPASWNFVRGGAMFYLSLSMGATGQAQEAERLLLEKYEFCSDKGDIYALILLQSLCFTHFYTGQLEQTRRVAHTLVQNSMSRDMSLMKLWGDWFLGMVAYLQNDLQAAAQYFTSIAENRYIAQISAYRDAVAGLALIHQIKGESLEATQWVESVSQYDLEQSGSEDERTRSLRARLMLMQGDLEGAGRWVDTYSGPPPDMALLLLEEPQVTRVRILVARGSGKDLQSALQILEVLEDIIDRTHNTSHKIEVLALRALALDAQGNSSEASVSLQQAVELSRASGLLQVFVELGKPMQEMLGRLAVSDHLGATIQRILAAFPGDAVSESPAEPVRGPLLNNLTLPEPLTKRELEILALLRTLKSIKDIAFDLSISPATVRSHTINIYAKLGVNNRWKAVARAEELNILPSS
jgi:LuxR family maltose regulon positive regulatory protein